MQIYANLKLFSIFYKHSTQLNFKFNLLKNQAQTSLLHVKKPLIRICTSNLYEKMKINLIQLKISSSITKKKLNYDTF